MIETYIFQADYFYFILILQQWQHIFYYSTWDKSAAAKVKQVKINVVFITIVSEGDLLVKFRLEQRKVEPAGSGPWNCF